MIDHSKLEALMELARSESCVGHLDSAMAVLHLVMDLAPDEPEPRRLLAELEATAGPDNADAHWHAEIHAVLGDARRLLGDTALAAFHYTTAFKAADITRARVGLSLLRMPGPDYYAVLERFHTALRPTIYLEIGVATGKSLAIASPPTTAIGVDPAPRVQFEFAADTRLFNETSNQFFEHAHLASLLQGRTINLAFIDGEHLFEQALCDFINVEKYCGLDSVILLHDTVPLDEASQKRRRETAFYSGDVWKLVPCLKHYRPDLNIFTIAAPSTGLTVITDLDSTTDVLSDNKDEIIAHFIDTPYSKLESNLEESINLVPNDWREVEMRLKLTA